MKYIVFGDLHVHNHKKNHYYVLLSYQILEYLIDYAIKNNINNIIFLGDLFEKRDIVKVEYLTNIKQILLNGKEKGINFYFIVGNHDMPFQNTIKNNVLELFDEIGKRVKSEDLELLIKDGDYNLYGFNYNENIKNFNNVNNKSILFTHLDIKTFDFGNGMINDEIGYIPKHFQNFKLVFNGHYHTHQKKENIIIVGSPYKYQSNQIDKESGFYTFEINDKIKNVKFHELDFVPKMKVIELNDEKDLENIKNNEEIKNNYVKVIVNNTDVQFLNNLKDYLLTNNVVDIFYDIKEDNEVVITTETVEKIQNTIEDNKSFVDNITNILQQLEVQNIEEKINIFNKILQKNL